MKNCKKRNEPELKIQQFFLEFVRWSGMLPESIDEFGESRLWFSVVFSCEMMWKTFSASEFCDIFYLHWFSQLRIKTTIIVRLWNMVSLRFEIWGSDLKTFSFDVMNWGLRCSVLPSKSWNTDFFRFGHCFWLRFWFQEELSYIICLQDLWLIRWIILRSSLKSWKSELFLVEFQLFFSFCGLYEDFSRKKLRKLEWSSQGLSAESVRWLSWWFAESRCICR